MTDSETRVDLVLDTPWGLVSAATQIAHAILKHCNEHQTGQNKKTHWAPANK